MHMFLTGGTGQIGRRLIRRLVGRGDRVTLLSRRANAWELVGTEVTAVTGDPTQPGDWQDKLAECDAVINLAGANLFAKRWTADFKAELRASRIDSTRNVVEALRRQPRRADGSPKVLVQGSAIGYYGTHGEEAVTEETGPGSDILAKLCADWEQAALAAESAGVRVAVVRTGIVLDPDGGALQTLLPPFRLGVGGPVGMALRPKNWGQQYWGWIHRDDETGIMLLGLDHADARGPINAVAPNPVTSREFARELGGVLGRPAFMPTPVLGLRVLLGEVAHVIAAGARVLPTKALSLGYEFRFSLLGPALRDLLKPHPLAA